ncbi:MAG TPA: hypothetical protein VLG49_00545, partial [Rhabdochlamydiaceae bacterium]|nr:hypothetical protein [Rhabdochlamydiaceae bacterium]
MIDRTALNPANSAIIPYTPPKSAQEFVDGEVVKKAHTIFEKAIYFHLQECKCLKVLDDDLLKWRYHTHTNPIQSSQDFFSILRKQNLLP